MSSSIFKSFLITCIPMAFLLLSCKDNAQTPKTKLRAIDTVFESYYDFKKGINPIEATKAGFNKYNDTIANYISDNYQEFLKEEYANFLDQLNAYDESMMTEEQWLSLRVMRWDCSIKLEGLENKLVTMASPVYDLPSFELMPLLQIQSLHLYVAQLGSGASVQPFKTVGDYDNWLSRLEDYLTFLDTCIEKMEEGIAQKIVLPKTIVLKMMPQLQAFINTPVDAHLFTSPIRNFPEDLSDVSQVKIKKEYYDFVSNQLIPKYKTLDTFLKETYLPVCRETKRKRNLRLFDKIAYNNEYDRQRDS